MQQLRLYTKLIRLGQWYKNLIIFAPFLFTQNVQPLPALLLGFLGFSCVSSVTYIFNDWMDREKDRLHPIKKERPLASGKISGKIALTVALFLTLVVGGICAHLGLFYSAIILSYFIITNLYSLGLKNWPLIDILIIGINFSLRMMAGMQALPDANDAAYFGLLIGLIIIFLTHKRSSDIKMLKEKAFSHKPVLKFYTRRNNYFFRVLAYMLVIFSFFILWQKGLALHLEIGLYVQLLVTSFVFSENPEYTSRPQWLFKSKIWTGLLGANLLLFLFHYFLLV